MEYIDIEVKGFRSLQNCRFRINKGINVLVGPNGSGKTNVSSFIDFISTFADKGIYAAIGKAGGASRVFSVETIDSLSDQNSILSCKIIGHLPRPENPFPIKKSEAKSDPDPHEKFTHLDFRYNLTLNLSKATFDVSIDRESLDWNLSNENGEKSDRQFLTASATNKSLNKCHIIANGRNIFSMNIFSEEFIKNFAPRHRPNDEKLLKNLRKMTASGSKLGNSILNSAIAGYSMDIMAVRFALSFDRSFNISPDKVRDSEDIASTKGIESNGSGTLTLLYGLQKEHDDLSDDEKPSSHYSNITEAFYRISEHVQDIRIAPNLRTGRLDCYVNVGSSLKPIEIPFSSLSDGTAKWLAILCITRTCAHGYCIEEPENYLHPAAQRLFVETLRDYTKSKANPFFMVTTHSETVVNSVRPEELMICDYGNEGTLVRRLTNAKAVMRAINETGFGLGFFYANDRLQ